MATRKKLAMGALIGAAAGYVTGVLTAPKSGQETRNEVATRASEVKVSAETQLQDALTELNNNLNQLKSKSLALSAKARDEYDETLIKAKDAQNKANQILKLVKTGEATDPELSRAVKQAKQAAKNLVKYLKT